MKSFYQILFLLLISLSNTSFCLAQSADQYGEFPDEETIQMAYRHLTQPLFRIDGSIYVDVEEDKELVKVDSTKVLARINGLTMPEDVDWEVNKIGWVKVPVPEGILLEDFAMYVWNLPWVVLAEYNLYIGHYADDSADINGLSSSKVRLQGNGVFRAGGLMRVLLDDVEPEEVKVQMVSLSGMHVFAASLCNDGTFTIPSDISNSIYVLRITCRGKTDTYKMMVK